MPDPFDLPQRLCVAPALGPDERTLLSGFATATVRRVWPGQPGARSPWTVCPEGCCLLLSERVGPERTALWLRFLLRELVAARSYDARQRAEAAGLGRHRVDGRVLVAGGLRAPRLLRVADSRVRELVLDDELFAVEDARRGTGPAEVVDLHRPVAEESD